MGPKFVIDSQGEGGIGKDAALGVGDSFSLSFGIDFCPWNPRRLPPPAAIGLPVVTGGLIRKVCLLIKPAVSALGLEQKRSLALNL